MNLKRNIAEPIETYNQTNFPFTNYSKLKKLEPIVKWAGGKEKELKYIIPNLPEYFENYYEPFVGGGSVYTAIQSKKAFINDKSKELISIYKIIISTERKEFFKALKEITHNWELLGKVPEKNRSFFINMYKDYSKNRIDFAKLTNELYEFILKHSEEFSGVFSTFFNFNFENFIKEIKKNLIRKIKRMKELEIKKKNSR